MSKAFRFSLEAALRQRACHEQEIQIALAQLVTGHGAALAHLDHLEQLRVQARRNIVAAGALLEPEARMNELYYGDRCTHVVHQQRQVVAQWEQEVQRVRMLLVAASQRRRALERLRERRHREFTTEMQRRMDLQLDELVTQRHGNPANEREQRHHAAQ